MDDDVKTMEFASLCLKHDGYRFLPAYGGNKALCLDRESQPDLIVLDIMLSVLDGMKNTEPRGLILMSRLSD